MSTVIKTTGLLSRYITWSTPQDTIRNLYLESNSTEENQEKMPHLAFMRIELTRLRSGMSDFLFRASSPGPTPGSKPTIVTLRGDKSFGKLEGCVAAARVVFREMQSREDKTHTWDSADPTYLAKMIYPHCKFFVNSVNTDTLSMTTDAIH